MIQKIMLSLFLAWSCVVAVSAQQPTYEDLTSKKSIRTRSFGDYLVTRALMNNGNYLAQQEKVKVSETDVRLAKTRWTERINFNVGVGGVQDTFLRIQQRIYSGPAFNVGVSLNLGGFVNNGKGVTKARHKKKVTEHQLKASNDELKGLVLTSLEKYNNAREILKIRRQAQIDNETNYTLVQSLFERGKATFEDLAQASEVYHNSVEAVASAESKVRLAEIEIEEIVGEPWENLVVARSQYLKGK